MSLGTRTVDNLTSSNLQAHRCTIVHDASPVCRRPFAAKRALDCHERMRAPAWRRCCKRKIALQARKAADDGDDVKVTTWFLFSPPAKL